jgi:hypothetical protein
VMLHCINSLCPFDVYRMVIAKKDIEKYLTK